MAEEDFSATTSPTKRVTGSEDDPWGHEDETFCQTQKRFAKPLCQNLQATSVCVVFLLLSTHRDPRNTKMVPDRWLYVSMKLLSRL